MSDNTPQPTSIDPNPLTFDDAMEITTNLLHIAGAEVARRFLAQLHVTLKSEEFQKLARWEELKQAADEHYMENPSPTEEETVERELFEERVQLEEFEKLLRTYTQLPSQLSTDPPSWLLDEFIGESVLTLIHGTQGHGKSMLALWIAKAIATGSDLLGRKGSGRARPVIFIDKENPQSIVRKRLASIGALDLPNLFYWGEWRYPNRPPSAFKNDVLDKLADLGKPFFIFDSLSSFEEGVDENLPAEMQRVMEKAHLLAFHSAGCLVLHHDNKDGGFRGATPITAVPEMAIHLYQNGNTRHITLSETKFRMCGSWRIKLKMPFDPQPACALIEDSRSGATPVEDGLSRDAKINLVQACLNLSPNATAPELEKATGVDDSTINRWFKHETLSREFRVLKIG